MREGLPLLRGCPGTDVLGPDHVAVESPKAWHRSMRLLKEEVLPLCADLAPAEVAAV
jgi:hypothetical protein